MRKHVKTVHGADFYAHKRHKGNGENGQGGSGGGGGGSGGGGGNGAGADDASPYRSDEMPMSAKTVSVSSPSIKSEVRSLKINRIKKKNFHSKFDLLIISILFLIGNKFSRPATQSYERSI